MRLTEKRATTKVIAKAKTLVGQTVEVTLYTNPANPYQDRYAWACGGCRELKTGSGTSTRDATVRDANRHAAACRVIPA